MLFLSLEQRGQSTAGLGVNPCVAAGMGQGPVPAPNSAPARGENEFRREHTLKKAPKTIPAPSEHHPEPLGNSWDREKQKDLDPLWAEETQSSSVETEP